MDLFFEKSYPSFKTHKLNGLAHIQKDTLIFFNIYLQSNNIFNSFNNAHQ